MPRTILLIVHQRRSDPGRVALRLRTLGYQMTVRRPALGDPLPDDFDDFDGAIIFGGPMSANDDHEPFIRAELDWIPRFAESGRPFLGICLGAQLLARSLGGRISAHPDGKVEIGYYPIWATTAGRELFDPCMRVFQWHREGFEVPECAELLARGDGYPNQAFRYGDNAYALQFHPEVTEAINIRWIDRGAHRLVLPGAQSREEQLESRRAHDPPLERWLDRFLIAWLSCGRTSGAARARRSERAV